MKVLVFVAKLLVFVGALNWGLMGVTGFGDSAPLNLVEKITDPIAGEEPAEELELARIELEAVGEDLVINTDPAEELVEETVGPPGQNALENIVYILVGVAALFLLWHHFAPCCKGEKTEGACCEPAPKADAPCGSPEG
jgi:uncharacterized membrane protein YuzA (DUF378 family)